MSEADSSRIKAVGRMTWVLRESFMQRVRLEPTNAFACAGIPTFLARTSACGMGMLGMNFRRMDESS